MNEVIRQENEGRFSYNIAQTAPHTLLAIDLKPYTNYLINDISGRHHPSQNHQIIFKTSD